MAQAHVTEIASSARTSVDEVLAMKQAKKALAVDERAPENAPMVRRQGRAILGTSKIAPATLYINDMGVLLWEDMPVATALTGRRMRRGHLPPPMGDWVQTVPFARLERNKVVDFIADVDDMLNGEWGLRRIEGGSIKAGYIDKLTDQKHRLLLVHGTFSKTQAFLDGIAASPDRGAAFWSWANRYDEILCFDHPTLSVSPVLNALDLSRVFAGAAGPLDIIAHSRGGLVVRWFLEILGAGRCSPCRAVLVGAPLAGTGLASPPRLKAALSLLTNIGNAMRLAGDAASLFQPWIAGPTALMRIATSFTGVLAATPIADVTVALIPGIAGQSRVGNNPEILRLRTHAPSAPPSYWSVTSDFETEDAGWRFWKWFRAGKIADAATDEIFKAPNDLVVDTDSMADMGVPALKPKASLDFGTNSSVYHTNYFRQPRTLEFIAQALA